MKNLISRPNHNLILILLCGFVFLTSVNVQGQSPEKSNKFFQTSALSSDLSLPILIDYSNEDRTKPFDTYQFGLGINIYTQSKEIVPITKLEFNVGMLAMLSFQKTDVYLPEDYLIGSARIEAGTSLIFKDVLAVGVSLPLGYGNTSDAPYTYRTIIGITPNVRYIFKYPFDTERIFIKCEFPMWRNISRPPSRGLIVTIGFMQISGEEEEVETSYLLD